MSLSPKYIFSLPSERTYWYHNASSPSPNAIYRLRLTQFTFIHLGSGTLSPSGIPSMRHPRQRRIISTYSVSEFFWKTFPPDQPPGASLAPLKTGSVSTKAIGKPGYIPLCIDPASLQYLIRNSGSRTLMTQQEKLEEPKQLIRDPAIVTSNFESDNPFQEVWLHYIIAASSCAHCNTLFIW